ncbi:MAG: hypothetical protein E7207_00140 [Clostridium butyricum]|nr:hypothetical protein [Clostridium butyricum]
MKCPFWSSKRMKVECYGECPMHMNEKGEYQTDEQCIFNECSSDNEFNLKDIIKYDYSYLKSYDDEKGMKISF